MPRINWKPLYDLIRENYDLIKNAKDIRESYYIVRDTILPRYMSRNDDLRIIFEALKTDKGYNYYAQDVWPRLEAEGYERPEAKPVGFVIHLNERRDIVKFLEGLPSSRGVIFVEKASTADHLKPLTTAGYIIIAGQGFPTRLMRILSQRHELFVLHDADKSGQDIFRVFAYGSKRLRRVSEDLALKFIVEKTKDIGLSFDDARKLGLTGAPAPERDIRAGIVERYELQNLVILKEQGLFKNPWVAYVGAKLVKLGKKIAPMFVDAWRAYYRSARWIIARAFEEIIDEPIREKARQFAENLPPTIELDSNILRNIIYESLKEFLPITRDMIVDRIHIEPHDLTVYFGTLTGVSNENEYHERFIREYEIDKMLQYLEG